MKNFNRIIAGKKSKSRGEYWEALVRSVAYRQGFGVIRIPDGCRQVSAVKLLRVKTPFDFVLVKQPSISIFVDTKTTKAKAFCFSALTTHQIEALMDCEKAGFDAGYLVHFQTSDEVVFFSAITLNRLGMNASLKPNEGLIIGREQAFDLNQITNGPPGGVNPACA